VFEGFPSESMRWFDEAAGLDDWPAVQARKADHDRWIRRPMVELCTELADEFGAPYIWRLHRSRWFWAHQHAEIQIVDTIELGVTLSGDGLLVGGGWMRSSPDQVRRFREAVDGPPGKELEEAIADAQAAGFGIGGHRLVRVPRGFGADHPRADLLRCRTLSAEQGWPADGWLTTREALERVRAGWRALDPLTAWLAEFIGPRESRM